MKTAVGVSLLFHGVLLTSLAFHNWPASEESIPAPLAVSLVLPPAAPIPEEAKKPEPVREAPIPPEQEEVFEREERKAPSEKNTAASTAPSPPEESAPIQFSPPADSPIPPTLISELTVVYPYKARKKGYEGRVLCRVWIGTDGAILDAMIYTSSGYDLLDQAALEAVRGGRYSAGTREDFVEVNVVFQLS